MTPREIIAIDADKNHSGASVEGHIKRIGQLLAVGGQVVQQGNTLFMYMPMEGRRVEFHTYNADPAQNLAENARKFFRMLKRAGSKEAYTTYTNPKISKVFAMMEPEFKAEITTDGSYTAKVRL